MTADLTSEPMTLLIEAQPLEFSNGDITGLAKAMVVAQGAMGDVIKQANNPAFKSKYADLAAVVEAVLPALNAAGLAMLQGSSTRREGGKTAVTIETRLLHESGQWARTRLTLWPSKDDPQGVGSAITYGRRYGLQAVCGVAPEDDDANRASGNGKTDSVEPPASTAAPAPMTQTQFDRIKALHAQLFADVPDAPTIGKWLVANVRDTITAKNPPTFDEANAALAKLDELCARQDTGQGPEGLAVGDDAADAQLAFAATTGADVGGGFCVGDRLVRVQAMFRERDRALKDYYPGVGKQEDRRHKFATDVLGNGSKASSKSWNELDYAKIVKALEAIAPDAAERAQ